MTKFTETIILKLTPDQKALAQKMADRAGLKITELFRVLLYINGRKEEDEM